MLKCFEMIAFKGAVKNANSYCFLLLWFHWSHWWNAGRKRRTNPSKLVFLKPPVFEDLHFHEGVTEATATLNSPREQLCRPKTAARFLGKTPDPVFLSHTHEVQHCKHTRERKNSYSYSCPSFTYDSAVRPEIEFQKRTGRFTDRSAMKLALSQLVPLQSSFAVSDFMYTEGQPTTRRQLLSDFPILKSLTLSAEFFFSKKGIC